MPLTTRSGASACRTAPATICRARRPSCRSSGMFAMNSLVALAGRGEREIDQAQVDRGGCLDRVRSVQLFHAQWGRPASRQKQWFAENRLRRDCRRGGRQGSDEGFPTFCIEGEDDPIRQPFCGSSQRRFEKGSICLPCSDTRPLTALLQRLFS